MKALIIANGELFQVEALRHRINAAAFDIAVAADGGARNARILNVPLQAVVGDMDSLADSERLQIKGAELVIYPREKEATDLELALFYARKRGAGRIVIAGATGGRLESTIGNTLLLAHQSIQECDVELWHGTQTARLVAPPGRAVPGEIGDTVSLVPLGGDASGVTTEGLRYPLRDETLFLGTTRGISNVIVSQPARINLAQGQLLLVHTPCREDAAAHSKKPVNVAVQVLPLVKDVYPVVDKAIAVIQESGVKFEVGPLETTMEDNDLDRLLEVAKAAHRACFEAGADKVVTFIKIADSLAGTTIEEKVGKYRKA